MRKAALPVFVHITVCVPFGATRNEDFLQAPAPDYLVWRRGRTMRRKGEYVHSTGWGREGDKGITNTHTHTRARTKSPKTRPYANRDEDAGVQEDTHPGRTSKHAIRAQISKIVVSSTT